jgi:hypothetical protein
MIHRRGFMFGCAGALISSSGAMASALAPEQKPAPGGVTYPPTLPDGRNVVTDTPAEVLKPLGKLSDGVSVAKTPPTIDFLFYPGQTYAGNPWSNWGDSLAVGGKYYASIGDHLSLRKGADPKNSGNAFVYEYDPAAKRMRQLVDVKRLLNLPAGHYTPGKIHGRIDQGSDGWLYFATYRGGFSTTDEFNYRGDWILRCDPRSGKSEIVAHGPVPRHGIQTSILDAKRMIFYGGTRAGSLNPRGANRGPNDELFFAYDLRARKLLYSGPKQRCWPWPLLAASTGRAYYVSGTGKDAVLMRFDPERAAKPTPLKGSVEFEGASTAETRQGFVYTASFDRETRREALWSFNTKTEEIRRLGPACVGATPRQIASLALDPGGRYLYYTPGAHGRSEEDGTPIVQYDIQTGRKKVLAFLHPFYQKQYGCMLRGTYSSAVDPKGDKLYVTWNVSRGSKVWDSCALTVIHIPPAERPGT